MVLRRRSVVGVALIFGAVRALRASGDRRYCPPEKITAPLFLRA
jgi:hypothetical protein